MKKYSNKILIIAGEVTGTILTEDKSYANEVLKMKIENDVKREEVICNIRRMKSPTKERWVTFKIDEELLITAGG